MCRGFYPAQRRWKQWGGRWYHHHVCFVITVESMHLTAHIEVGPATPLQLFWRMLATISFFQQCLSETLETVTIQTLFQLVADHTLPHSQPQPYTKFNSPLQKSHPFSIITKIVADSSLQSSFSSSKHSNLVSFTPIKKCGI
ncbi:hypothetical protein V8G54_035832 [Vigna mungo]|uniref:Uncharacterized protein n=1 Tax=Vigna mungo TaxID=3915 RepID=A0AAQ3RBP2_VIGMU